MDALKVGFLPLLGNFYYVDNLLIYIMNKVPSKQFMLCFRIVASLVIFVGAGLSMSPRSALRRSTGTSERCRCRAAGCQ